MKKVLYAALFMAVASVGCKKDDKTCDTNTQTLSGSYRVIAATYKMSASAPEQDYLSTLDACERDDVITLNSNGTVLFTDAGITCTPNGSDSGTWTVVGSTFNMEGIAYTILSFDCSTLVITDTDPSTGETFKITLKK